MKRFNRGDQVEVTEDTSLIGAWLPAIYVESAWKGWHTVRVAASGRRLQIPARRIRTAGGLRKPLTFIHEPSAGPCPGCPDPRCSDFELCTKKVHQ